MKKVSYEKPIVKMMAIGNETLLETSPLLQEDENGNPFQELGENTPETPETGGNLGKRYNVWDTWEE